MERKITPDDIRKSANEAFEKAKAMNEGTPDARLDGVDPEKFGLSITLVDGTIINIGDTDTRAAIGGIARIPALLALMQQTDNPVEAAEKSDVGAGCGCKRDRSIKPRIPVGAYSVRIVSAIEPNGDPDSKWNEIINGMISAMGSTPVLDDALYKKLTKINIDSNAEDVLADIGFYLYDDAAPSIDLYTRLTSICASASQLSAYGATIAAAWLLSHSQDPGVRFLDCSAYSSLHGSQRASQGIISLAGGHRTAGTVKLQRHDSGRSSRRALHRGIFAESQRLRYLGSRSRCHRAFYEQPSSERVFRRAHHYLKSILQYNCLYSADFSKFAAL